MNSEFWDKRALGAFRLALGLVLTLHTLLCLYWGNTFFTDFGVLPMETRVEIPNHSFTGSLYMASRWWLWAYGLLFVQLLLSLCLAVGFRVSAIVLPLAYLFWSLQARNPMVFGLGEQWAVLLIISCGLLPIDEEYSVESRGPWRARWWPEGWGPPVALILILSPLAACLWEQLCSAPAGPHGWIGLLALVGLLLPVEHRVPRNLGVAFLWGWSFSVWGLSGLTLVTLLTGSAFLSTQGVQSKASEGSLYFLPLTTVVLLQVHSLLYASGLVKVPFEMRLARRQVLCQTDGFSTLGFSEAGSGSGEARLFPVLVCRSFLMKRYLNGLHAEPDRMLARWLMTYHISRTVSLEVGESRRVLYNHFDESGEAIAMYEFETVPKKPEIWERMPTLDRSPLQ